MQNTASYRKQTVSNVHSIAVMCSLHGDGFIISPLHEPVSLSLPEGIHGSDEGFSLVLACSQSRSSSLPWLYPHAASGFSKLQSPVTEGRNLCGYTVFPLTCCSYEWIYKLNSPLFSSAVFIMQYARQWDAFKWDRVKDYCGRRGTTYITVISNTAVQFHNDKYEVSKLHHR